MALSRRERREKRKKLLKEERLSQIRALQQKEEVGSKKEYKGVLRFYDKQYKKLVFIPFIILVLAIISIIIHATATGDFINKGVSLKGGIVITIPVEQEISPLEIEERIKNELAQDIDVRSIAEFGEQKAIIITSEDIESQDQILSIADQLIPGAEEQASVETTGSSLGAGFFRQVIIALIIAFILMGVVVFLYFKTPVPSAAVILAVFSDIVVSLAIVNLLGIKLSTAGIAAFLMLIGYSVDTDILLSTRVLKRKQGTVFDRVISAAKTGLTMNITTLVAVVIAMVVTPSETIKQIMTILFIGLIVDIINTWLQNTGILRYYLERKARGPASQ